MNRLELHLAPAPAPPPPTDPECKAAPLKGEAEPYGPQGSDVKSEGFLLFVIVYRSRTQRTSHGLKLHENFNKAETRF